MELHELDQFTGTTTWYRHWTRHLLYTDGVQYLAEHGEAYWLIDLIASHQPKLRKEPFQLWELTIEEDHTGLVACRRDTGQAPLVEQKLEFTDFPLPYIKLYVCESEAEPVLMVPNEY